MNIITVTQVNTYIKAVLDENQSLKNIYIVGEISNFLHYFRSGHMYFTLKDEQSQIKAVMFCTYAQKLKFAPEDGMKVICRGRVSAYEKDGVYQLYVEDMQPDGVGALNLAYEQLKEKLSSLGYFDEEHKKQLPKYPAKIGVATSDVGAAVEDIKNITKRRYPICELVIVPTQVQGAQASKDIVKSLEFLDSLDDIDLIIVGRGGGSIEDLWAFNTEEVAMAVYNCKKPVISAVGHETDYTICDFVSDLRAPTPSAAAELAVPDSVALQSYFENIQDILLTSLNTRVDREFQILDALDKKLFDLIKTVIEENKQYLDSVCSDLISTYKSAIEKKSNAFIQKTEMLNALSPLATILRGYCIAFKDGKVLRSSNDAFKNDEILLKLADGDVNCRVV